VLTRLVTSRHDGGAGAALLPPARPPDPDHPRETPSPRDSSPAPPDVPQGHKLDLIEFTPPALGDNEVFVDIKYCGMCHSDVHKVTNEWHDAVAYPMVPGHEVVGTVVAAGPAVTKVRVGQVVGFGPQRNSCHSCGYCADGVDNCCTKFEGLYDPKFGGYATSITVNENFAFPIPDGIPAEVAGPLLCAGVTTFAPLARNVKPGDRVGVVGIGGLGHMGLQYAAAMGAETWAISTSAAKEAEARKFGAARFLVSTDADAMKAVAGTFDFILCCASGDFPTGAYLRLLKPRKSFCLVGLPAVDQPVKFLPFDIIAGEKNIIGSMIGGTVAMKDMLEFSAAHRCFPQVEVIDFADANKGFEKILANSARYRMVLKIEGFREAQKA
jgi:D-arabinose 1-dehydrogenase-like Zn-dependent alcohol dehydrogenase